MSFTVVTKSKISILALKMICFYVLLHRSISISQPLMKCKRVFQALINIAVEELCETADSLIAPEFHEKFAAMRLQNEIPRCG